MGKRVIHAKNAYYGVRFATYGWGPRYARPDGRWYAPA